MQEKKTKGLSTIAEWPEMQDMPVESESDISKDVQPMEETAFKYNPKEFILLRLKKGKSGTPVSTIQNFVTIMEQDPVIAGKICLNELNALPLYKGNLAWRLLADTNGIWSDVDDANLVNYIEREYGIRNEKAYKQAFIIVINRHRINPFNEYLEECEEEWDGQERIASFLKLHFGIEGQDEYFASVLQNYMFAIISRAVYWPGCKYDYVPVLIGQQGIGKSTFFESLAGKDEWFSDSLTEIKGKDAYIQLQGKVIVEMGELTTFRKADQESLKGYISARSDYFRPPYGVRAENHSRRNVFAGTTNVENFLVDRTGNRRYLPIHLKGITKKRCGIDPQIVKQLWGEAVIKYKEAGFTETPPNLKLPDEIEEIALRMQMTHLEEDSWAAAIEGYLTSKQPGATVSTMDLYLEAIGASGKPSRAESSRIIAIMNNEVEGWENVGRRRDKKHGNMRLHTWQCLPVQTEMGVETAD